eukprot:TRINITY_DN512_c0_g1_i1.p1 TRINITY_DN512_c0_g1~~TRINITY_DN512_c0_g1_i1.p1  ORF type:complete len:781 (+),score=284.48 TRINITY_DN512_c0_g1_i1:88-2430(+)
MEGPVDITASEIKELRPWIKERLIKLQGFVDQDEFLFKAIIDSLENQRPRQKILEQLKMFNLESSVRVLLENIEQQTKVIREKKKQMRMEKRKHTSISFDDEDNDKDDERKKTKRETNLESLRAMETTTAMASSGAIPTPSSTATTSAKEERSKERDREDRSSRDKERSSRDKERSSRSSRDKERSSRDKDKSRHDKDRRDHRDHKEHRSSSSSSSKEASKEESVAEKAKSNGSQQQPATLPTINIPAISLPQPEDLQAKINSLLNNIAKTQASLQTPAQKSSSSSSSSSDAKDKIIALAVEKAKQAALATQKIGLPQSKAKEEDRFIPPPLMVDAEGYEVDSHGNRIETRVAPLPSTLANKRLLQQKLLEEDTTQPIEKSPFYDPRVATSKGTRSRKTFNFVEAGTYIKMGQRLRTKVQLAAMNEKSVAEEKEKDDNLNLIALGTKEEQFFKKKTEGAIPQVEWWDQYILSEKEDYASPLLTDKITIYVEHPILIAPPAEAPPPPPQPLKLTKKETKKLRRITRAEAQKEKQERILLGLEKPQENKVKISNLMRVLGTEAVQDPTQIEKEVRKQMAQRMKNHQMRNEERKLTKEQRSEKLRKKYTEDTSVQTHVAVYQVDDLRDNRKKAKIRKNAVQNNFTGCLLMYHGHNIVVVEGGPKGLNRFKKLMLRRIAWNSKSEGGEEANEDDETTTTSAGDDAANGGGGDNRCLLVWEGIILKPNFKHFVVIDVKSESEARRVLREHSIEHFFDMASALGTHASSSSSSSDLLPQHTSLPDT